VETLKLGARLQTRDSEVLLDPTLPVGRYVVTLVVTTDRSESEPAKLTITVQRPIVPPPAPEPSDRPFRPTPEPPVLRPTPVPPVVRPTPVPPIARPTPVPPIVRPSPVPPVLRPIPVNRDATPPRPRKSRAKKARPKKEE
jgi:hypothetical protein